MSLFDSCVRAVGGWLNPGPDRREQFRTFMTAACRRDGLAPVQSADVSCTFDVPAGGHYYRVIVGCDGGFHTTCRTLFTAPTVAFDWSKFNRRIAPHWVEPFGPIDGYYVLILRSKQRLGDIASLRAELEAEAASAANIDAVLRRMGL